MNSLMILKRQWRNDRENIMKHKRQQKNVWNGPYHVQCPKCKGRNIQLVEVTEGNSTHIIRNGEWDQSEDNNEYGSILRSEMTCLDCGHQWTRRGFSIDSYLKY